MNDLPYSKYSSYENICIKNSLKFTGLYFDEKLKIFKKCNEKCSECNNELNCLSCNIEKEYYPKDKDTSGLCFKKSEKIQRFYFDIKSSSFKTCFKGCLNCKSLTECLECDSANGFFYLKYRDYNEKDCKFKLINF